MESFFAAVRVGLSTHTTAARFVAAASLQLIHFPMAWRKQKVSTFKSFLNSKCIVYCSSKVRYSICKNFRRFCWREDKNLKRPSTISTQKRKSITTSFDSCKVTTSPTWWRSKFVGLWNLECGPQFNQPAVWAENKPPFVTAHSQMAFFWSLLFLSDICALLYSSILPQCTLCYNRFMLATLGAWCISPQSCSVSKNYTTWPEVDGIIIVKKVESSAEIYL